MVIVWEGLYCLVLSFHPVIKHGIIARSIHCQLYAVLKALCEGGFIFRFIKHINISDYLKVGLLVYLDIMIHVFMMCESMIYKSMTIKLL